MPANRGMNIHRRKPDPERTKQIRAQLEKWERKEASVAGEGADTFKLFVELIAGIITVKAEGEDKVLAMPLPNLALLGLWTERADDFINSIWGAARLRYALTVQKSPEKMDELFRGEWPEAEVRKAAADIDGIDAFTYLMAFRAVVDFINETVKKKEVARLEAALGVATIPSAVSQAPSPQE